MGKVISLAERAEVWSRAYCDPSGKLTIMASNHGRLRFNSESGRPVTLDFVETAGMLSCLSSEIEKAMGIMYEK